MADDPGFAPAKVNLALHVVGQRSDGLHLLDSLVAFADIGDHLKAKLAHRSSISITGPMAAGVPSDGQNLVLQAARWIGVSAEFQLEKHLPAAAGIGGGSSDAAAALRLLSRLTSQPIPSGAAALGADVPVCLRPGSTRMRGVGDRLEPVTLPALPALLVNPGVPVPTGAVFAALTNKDNAPMPVEIPDIPTPEQAALWLASQRNDLQIPALSLVPEIGDVLARLAALPGARLARMSGSGATCFALFDTIEAASTAQATLHADHSDWWVAATQLH